MLSQQHSPERRHGSAGPTSARVTTASRPDKGHRTGTAEMCLKAASLRQSAFSIFFSFLLVVLLGFFCFVLFYLETAAPPTAERRPSSGPHTAARAALLESDPSPRPGRTHSQDGGGAPTPARTLSPPREGGSAGVRRAAARKGNPQPSARLPVPLPTRTTGAARLPPSPRSGRGSGTRRPGPTHSAPTAARALPAQPSAPRTAVGRFGPGRDGGPALTFYPQLLHVGLQVGRP